MKLLQTNNWVTDKIEKREKARALKAKKIQAERLERKAKGLADLGEYKYEPRYIVEIPLEVIDRTVAG